MAQYKFTILRKEAAKAKLLIPSVGDESDVISFEITATTNEDAKDSARSWAKKYKLKYWELHKIETTAIDGCELFMSP